MSASEAQAERHPELVIRLAESGSRQIAQADSEAESPCSELYPARNAECVRVDESCRDGLAEQAFLLTGGELIARLAPDLTIGRHVRRDRESRSPHQPSRKRR